MVKHIGNVMNIIILSPTVAFHAVAQPPTAMINVAVAFSREEDRSWPTT
jgi:hypothetical protein